MLYIVTLCTFSYSHTLSILFSCVALPDTKTKRYIFKIHTSRMSLSDDVDLEEFVMAKDDLSGADIKAVCTEAGLLALRERRMRVNKADFTAAREKVLYRKNE